MLKYPIKGVNFLNVVGENLKYWRKMKGLTQEELAGIEEMNGKNIIYLFIYLLNRYIANENNGIEKIDNLKKCVMNILDQLTLK